MRPQITLPKGAKSQLPSVLTRPPMTRPVQPKTFDDFMDRVIDVKDLSGKVIFTGSPRQWQKWASQREAETRRSFGLPVKTASATRSRSGK